MLISFFLELLYWWCLPKTLTLHGHGASDSSLSPTPEGKHPGCAPRCPFSGKAGMLRWLPFFNNAGWPDWEERHTLIGWETWYMFQLSRALTRWFCEILLLSGPSSLVAHADHFAVDLFLHLCTTDTVPIKTLCHSCASTPSTAPCACHLLPVFTWIPADTTLLSDESLYIMTFLARVTLNSSTRPLKASCSMLDCPYRATLLGDRGSPNQR